MKKIAFVFAALIALTATAKAQANADDTQRPMLRAEAIVSGDVVRIGELIENAGIVSEVAIFRAPDLGTTGRVRVTDVFEAVRPHALVGLDAGGLTEISVTRPSRMIAAQAIETAIATGLASQFGLGQAKNVALSFDRGLAAIYAEPGTSMPQVGRLVFDQRSGRFDATIEIPGKNPLRKRFTGVAVATADIVTLNRALSRGDIIKASDLMVERRARAEVPADAANDVNTVVGQALRASVAPGRALRSADLMKPEFVQRNETVTLIYEVPGIALTGRGKALESGSDGDAIEVLNVQSKRTVQGIVTGPGQVTVTMRSPRVVARAEAAQ